MHLFVASKDHIFVFSLQDMQSIALIKAPSHLLRIAMSPNLSSEILTEVDGASSRSLQKHYVGHEILNQ